ncbi:MAG: N-acetyl-gamma-glutamyl-phosphate reductase [Oscillospiraceae bacterium]|nr:N-acetyl-gamma-glutamyl-phosphate reductase [Oscillospiraceae bacterium]
MSKPKVFIDGQEGTTGLDIHNRLWHNDAIELLTIEPALRKDAGARKKLINDADVVILALPDAAAREAVALLDADNRRTRVLDASTAHRTADGWQYGLPELIATPLDEALDPELYRFADLIRVSRFVANPGCHATGFIMAVHPLVFFEAISRDALLTCTSLTGYSGGGKKMIAEYEHEKTDPLFAPAVYGLSQEHKHLPEMTKYSGLRAAPVFLPIVDDFYKGMAVNIGLHGRQLLRRYTPETLAELYAQYYAGQTGVAVRVAAADEKLYATRLAGRDDIELVIAGNEERVTVTALFDNLGKGASGAAEKNLTLMLSSVS